MVGMTNQMKLSNSGGARIEPCSTPKKIFDGAVCAIYLDALFPIT